LITVARDRFYALEKMPNATDAQKIKAQLMLGHMNRWLGKNDTAALWYQRALTLDPTNKTAQVHLALVSR
jgi:cytochrome c-type biogenesis protein CcmH/NrfG